MIFSKFNEIKNLTVRELNEEIVFLKKELFVLRIKKATLKKIKPHLLKHLKHRISQILFYKSQLKIKNKK
jgi:large subunit ribosomal protein L29